MISIKNLSFRYKGSEKNALTGINLDIPEGDFLGIIGSSGAGKSTLTYGINGIVPHHFPGDFYGEIRVNGLDTLEAGTEVLARQVGSVFQDIEAQIVSSVTEDEILFGLENFGVPRDEIEGRVEEALAAAGIPELKKRTIGSLSGGQKQKVVIAAITALKPGIILLDEPTGELDPRSSRLIFEYLKKLNEEWGITVVVVEQKVMLLCEFAKRLAVMDRGSLILTGPVKEVLGNAGIMEAAGVNIPRVSTLGRRFAERGWYAGEAPYNLSQAAEMMRAVLAPAERAGPGDVAVSPPQPGNIAAFETAVSGDTRSRDTRSWDTRSGEKGEPMLSFQGVSFGYGAGTVLSDLSFQIGRGEFVALLGENGAGKSTLARLSNGLLKPSSGVVRAGGRDTRTCKVSLLARGVGYLFQNPDRQLCQNTAREEILFGLEYVIPGDEEERRRRTGEMLDLFSLDGDRAPFDLSRGERQQLALASVLARRPPLLILDEPTTGLDYRECMTIMGIISRLHREGTTILMISHDMEVAADFAGRALVLSRGRLIGDGPVRDILKNPDLLSEASLLPPQIPALALALGPPFGEVFTLDDMTALTGRLRGPQEEARI
ncbi:MAG: ATP-binding cassette domain-containing protein [Treponema sp.]|jgi:energy-coupling factor transport system ATP-binding protein|nr:ATP-binding cassette domain-containing protein [Treponema sp.]